MGARTRSKQARAGKSLMQHLATGPVLAIAIVTFVCVSFTTLSVRALLNCLADSEATQLAYKINHLAAKTPDFQALTRRMQDASFLIEDLGQVRIFTKAGKQTYGARVPARQADDLRKSISAAVASMRFPIRTSGGGLIFPLATLTASLEHKRLNAEVLRQVQALAHQDNVGLSRIVSDFLHHGFTDNLHQFVVPAGSISGVVVVYPGIGWSARLVLIFAILLLVVALAGFSMMVFILWRAIGKLILQPLKDVECAVSALHNGTGSSELPASNIAEFDTLNRQWNTLVKARQSADEHHRVLSQVLEHVPVGIQVAKCDGRIEYANPELCRMSGYSLFELVGKTPASVFTSPKVDPRVWQDAEQTVLSGRVWTGEVLSRCKSGGEFEYHLTLSPVLDPDGKVERIVSLRRDIAEAKLHERDLVEARRVAEEADRAKSEFVANMSHELRTPLHSIIGFASFLREEKLGPLGNHQYVEFAQTIEQGAQNLLSSINSVLELSRMDIGRQVLREEPFLPGEAIRYLVRRFAADAANRSVHVSFNDRCAETSLNGDERAFRQIANHLLANALKFNRDGGNIDVSVAPDRTGRIVLRVRDSGVGIPPDQHARVTRAFYQIDGSTSRNHDGAGLGLTIVREIADAHGATVRFTAPAAGGTCVRVTFPADRTVALNPVSVGNAA